MFFCNENVFSQSKRWVGTWSCAPYAAGAQNTPPAPYIENNTLRQVVRVSIGGKKLRIKFSNKTSATPVTMKSVSIAVSNGGSAIDASTITEIKFKGSSSVTMEAFSSISSDEVNFPLSPSMRIAITIHYGQASSKADITSHVGSRTDSYILSGDQSKSINFENATVTSHWFHINTIDVIASKKAASIAILGNSITDGYGLFGGLQNRWSDKFSEKLLNNSKTKQVAVLNLGIGGTNVTGNSPTTGISRYKDDLLKQSGLRWIIIFYGTNDIAGGASADKIIGAYKKIIEDAHAMKVKVYGATITPFKGSGHYSVAHDSVRNTVNDWIRTKGNFDAFIDFDKIIRNPDDTSRLLEKYSKDWLHPNEAGYELLGQSIPLDLFKDKKNILD